MASPSAPLVGQLPPSDQLRQEAKIQEGVQARLKHLVDNAKPGKDNIKSHKGGSVDMFVKSRVKWPHGYVISGQTKDRVTYNQLSLVQWIAGFCRTIKEESDLRTKDFFAGVCH